MQASKAPSKAARQAPWPKRLRRELRVRALLLVLPALAHLPDRLRAPLAGLLGTLAWLLAAGERRLAMAHLEIAFPAWSPAERRRCARATFVSLVESALEVAAADRLQVARSTLYRRIRVLGLAAAS